MKTILLFLLVFASTGASQEGVIRETKPEYDARMAWWKEARFGLFIHWGLYSVPAGQHGGKTDYGEWIRTSAQIPLRQYDRFLEKFNPVKFDADEWVRMAKEAGMKYITITTKHHDGFCLFDSRQTDFDVMSTPFKRDVMKELSDACRKEGIRICWYHSIMDWHHPDYLPRRDWEKDRGTEGADYGRYVEYMKRQLEELVTSYGKIGVLWFDGEWEGTWNRGRGRDLYDYVRNLQPDIIVNNRVGAGRSGMEGFSEGEESAGDFGTPEQQIPPTGLPGVNWETCMTMNDHWGYNSRDSNWKSAKDLLQKLADIASKGGNFLLNVGPTSEGLFPDESVERLEEIGKWMKVNHEAIYGTEAGPFKYLEGARCTQKMADGNSRLYIHLFASPVGGKFILPGIFNRPKLAYLLADPGKNPLPVERVEDALIIGLPSLLPDTINSVLVLDLEGEADVSDPPEFLDEAGIFTDQIDLAVGSKRKNVEIRYTLDGSVPTASSPAGKISLKNSATVSARCFRDGLPVSGTSVRSFTKVKPAPAAETDLSSPGVRFAYYEGDWDSLPDFGSLKPVNEGKIPNFSFSPRREEERFAFRYAGYVKIPAEGVYHFYAASDDGSRLWVGSELVVDNDRLHGLAERSGAVALAPGFHPIRVEYFEKTGGDELKVSYRGPGFGKTAIPDSALFIK